MEQVEAEDLAQPKDRLLEKETADFHFDHKPMTMMETVVGGVVNVGTGVQILELWACLRTILRLFSLPPD